MVLEFLPQQRETILAIWYRVKQYTTKQQEQYKYMLEENLMNGKMHIKTKDMHFQQLVVIQ